MDSLQDKLFYIATEIPTPVELHLDMQPVKHYTMYWLVINPKHACTGGLLQ